MARPPARIHNHPEWQRPSSVQVSCHRSVRRAPQAHGSNARLHDRQREPEPCVTHRTEKRRRQRSARRRATISEEARNQATRTKHRTPFSDGDRALRPTLQLRRTTKPSARPYPDQPKRSRLCWLGPTDMTGQRSIPTSTGLGSTSPSPPAGCRNHFRHSEATVSGESPRQRCRTRRARTTSSG